MPALPLPSSRPVSRTARLARGATVLACSVLALALAPVVAVAQSLDGWTQFQGRADHLGSVADGPEPAFAESWSLEEPVGGATGTEGLSGIVAADGLVVTVGSEAVIAVESSTGADAWRIDRDGGPPVQPAIADGADGPVVVFPEGYGPNPPTPAPTVASPEDTASTSPDATASPADDDDDAVSGVDLVAVSLADGEEVWRTELPSPSRSGVSASGDVVLVGGNDGSVTALEAATGEIRWTQPVGDAVYAPVAVAGDLALASSAGTDGGAFAVVALGVSDGTQAWRYEPGGAAFFGSSAAVADGTAFVAFDDATVRAFDAATGEERWLARMNDISAATPPVVADDLVITVDVGGQVYAFDRATGESVWDHALNVGRPNVRSAAVVTGAHVVVPTTRGELFTVELATGDLVSSTDIADGPLRSLAVADGMLLGVRGGSRPGLVALGHDPEGPLFRVTSPTIFEPGTSAAAFAMAALPLVVLLILLGRFLSGRLGRPTLGRPTPVDPIEDALDDGEAST
jgi:outer membrane protein assembly factor BamB